MSDANDRANQSRSHETLVDRGGRRAWREFAEAPGVSFRLLRRHPEHQGSTLLIRFAPGTSYPIHRHPAGEEYYVLDGVLEDDDDRYEAGDYVYYPPGSIHQPRSTAGCTLLVFLPARVETFDRPLAE